MNKRIVVKVLLCKWYPSKKQPPVIDSTKESCDTKVLGKAHRCSKHQGGGGENDNFDAMSDDGIYRHKLMQTILRNNLHD